MAGRLLGADAKLGVAVAVHDLQPHGDPAPPDASPPVVAMHRTVGPQQVPVGVVSGRTGPGRAGAEPAQHLVALGDLEAEMHLVRILALHLALDDLVWGDGIVRACFLMPQPAKYVIARPEISAGGGDIDRNGLPCGPGRHEMERIIPGQCRKRGASRSESPSIRSSARLASCAMPGGAPTRWRSTASGFGITSFHFMETRAAT